MEKSFISLEKTGHFSRLFLDYVNGEKKLSSFYKYAPVIDSFGQAIEGLSAQKFNRQLLVEVITDQYRATNCLLPTAYCQLLLSEKTFTVCTGHQLCLFTGPLYFIYKIISTINLAEELKKKYPSYNFVPVYWMASEDHDFEEINHVFLFGKKIEWTHRQGGGAGRYSTNGISELIENLKSVLGPSPAALELTALFQKAYTQHADLSSATRYLVNELFGKYGLIILDADDRRLKQEIRPLIEEDIFNNASFREVSKTTGEMKKNGYEPQVNPREINVFYLNDNQRNRIEYKDNHFNVVDTQIRFTPGQLRNELDAHPERFSPNVVTRPLFQQTILPNLAYVGGPAEIAYWLEYKAMFEHYGIFYPVLVPRNFAMMIDAESSKKLPTLGLIEEDVFFPLNALTEKYISSIAGDKISFHAEREELQKAYRTISEKVSKVDASLAGAAQAELQKHLNSLDHLEKKMLKAFKHKNETAVGQIERIKQRLFPDGELQERHENFIPLYLKHGKDFIGNLKSAFDPFSFRFTILSEKE